MNRLFFDTETTGVLKFDLPASDPSQPHLVQLAALLHDENQQVRGALNVIIRPVLWEIPAESQAVHGISTEHALKYGVPLGLALDMFAALALKADLLVAHNTDFDTEVLAAQYFRQAISNPIPGKSLFCTMKESTDILKLPGRMGSYKWPRLDQAHRHFTGEGFDNAHDAMADVLACSRVFYKLTEQLKVTA